MKPHDYDEKHYEHARFLVTPGIGSIASSAAFAELTAQTTKGSRDGMVTVDVTHDSEAYTAGAVYFGSRVNDELKVYPATIESKKRSIETGLGMLAPVGTVQVEFSQEAPDLTQQV
jgi:hypothetical protein